MLIELKVRSFENSLSAVIPERVITRLNVKEGDSIYLEENPDRSFRILTEVPEIKELTSLLQRSTEGARRLKKAFLGLTK